MVEMVENDNQDKLELSRIALVDSKVVALEQQVMLMAKMHHIAQDKFEHSVQRRFAQVNEFRGALNDLSTQMATRRELETAVSSLSATIDTAQRDRNHQLAELRDTLAELRSRIDVGAPQIPELQKYVASTIGQKQGVTESRAGLYMLIGTIGGLLGILIVVANLLTNH